MFAWFAQPEQLAVAETNKHLIAVFSPDIHTQSHLCTLDSGQYARSHPAHELVTGMHGGNAQDPQLLC